ncbi:hypothetical protein Gohar_000480 [Gossypium harknessii]|uniref:Uncharacterized protein n=2 Tax=Gossypium TaxID=3633 RepID=A0A7J9I0W4_9ROSI|nr:hypothetical protein [Gossypium harknessii]
MTKREYCHFHSHKLHICLMIFSKFLKGVKIFSQNFRAVMPNEDEERMLNAKRQMAITFVEPCLSVSTVNLTKWSIGLSLSYIINGNYSKVLNNNRDSLKPNAVVQI